MVHGCESARDNGECEGEVMDTPDRSKNNQITASVSKFEDSPVFNFLNNLSPIKPVKSIPMSQTISSLNFAALPSVFTSPHVRDSRVLRRHRLLDPSNPEFASDHGSTVEASQVNIDGAKQSDAEEENLQARACDAELAVEPSFDCSQFVVDYSEDPSYEGSTPNSSSVLKAKNRPDYACSSSNLVPCVPDSSERIPYESELDLKGVRQMNRNEECPSCEWSDAFIFESPNDRDPYKKSDDNGESFYACIQNDMDNVQSLCAMSSSEQFGEGNRQDQLCTQPGEESEQTENAEACEIVAGSSVDHGIEEMDYELSSLYRGMRRRCLVFEMGGSSREQCEENLDASSSGMLQSDCNAFLNDQSAISANTANNSSRCVLPGIGLHLNTLAATPKDYRIIGNDSSASGRLVIGPSSSVNFHPSSSNQELLNNTLPVGLDEGMENTAIPVEDPTQEIGYMANEDISPNSPKKRRIVRRKADQAGDAEGCKRCNCKKSKCLKLYCECFAAGVYCVDLCSCIDCFNKPVHEDTVLATRKQIESRNPLAFAPKVIRGLDPLSETGDDSSKTPASARHKRGCNCKKSGCLKKYCECYQGGVGCSVNCRCEGCKNAFGRKDGYGVTCMEADAEVDETDVNEKSVLDRNYQKTPLKVDLDSAPPATPLRAGRQSLHHPFSSKKKPPRSSVPCFPSGFSTHHVLGKRSFQPPPKFDQHLETVKEDELPDFLQESSSPNATIKSSSPNGKRVSPPHGTTNLRSSRKLILQSIPSFPSLTQNQ